MRQLVFALQFKGSAAAVPGAEGKLSARTTARGQTHEATLTPTGVQSRLRSAGGVAATFESDVEMVGDGSFLESGRIAYGRAGHLTFRTVGRGTLGPSGIEGLQRGAVIWDVTGGDGDFAGATGLVTSNFTVGGDGQVVDNQLAVLFLPDRPAVRKPAPSRASRKRPAARGGRTKHRR